MGTTLYYFSATGNCLDVARDIQKSLGNTEIAFIPPLVRQASLKPVTEKVGFVFPVYDFGIPLVLRDFLNKLDITDVEYIFAVATCNYMPGLTLEAADEILKGKGARLNSGFIIRMPGNYIPIYGANSQRTQDKKFRRKAVRIGIIANYVRSNTDRGLEKSNLIIDRLLAPQMQKNIYKFYSMDRNFRADEKCSGCGLCQRICAFDNISIEEGKPQWRHRCQQCLACIHVCPKSSIQFGKRSGNKKRYRNPKVTVNDLISQKEND
ncbi:MAG: EFR1 family ferrodoxin [Bacillota bacterium]|nr:EFR1 family ferrodoxin [Bacillota bacterium]